MEVPVLVVVVVLCFSLTACCARSSVPFSVPCGTLCGASSDGAARATFTRRSTCVSPPPAVPRVTPLPLAAPFAAALGVIRNAVQMQLLLHVSRVRTLSREYVNEWRRWRWM
jgi:hypothetical protein